MGNLSIFETRLSVSLGKGKICPTESKDHDSQIPPSGGGASAVRQSSRRLEVDGSQMQAVVTTAGCKWRLAAMA